MACDDYYYIDDGESSCKPCHESCKRCTGPLESDCELKINLECKLGFYSNNGLCKPCIYPCETCSTDVYCITCGYDVDNRYDAPFCECFDHLSDYDNRCI